MKAKYFVAAALLLITACGKDVANLTTSVQGTWELSAIDGAWVGHRDYAPGNGNTYNFSGNNYSQTSISGDSTYHYSGTFKIYQGKPCDNAATETLIDFDDGNFPSSFSLSNDTLRIGSTACIADGGTSTYIKIK